MVGILTFLSVLAALLAVTVPVYAQIRNIQEQERTITDLREQLENWTE